MKLSPPPATEPGTPLRAVSSAPKALTVGEVVGRIRGLIKQAFPGPVWVEGQVSNCTYHSSGHIYFSLVDEQATDRFGQRLVLPCAFFRAANAQLKFRLEDGLKVLCLGEVATYEARGQDQLVVARGGPEGPGGGRVAVGGLRCCGGAGGGRGGRAASIS